ncbi:MAG: hypothetical protein K2X55_17965 [Burkholderiaceae bacterium]|nr:hypothetical protein [Burkholderiaceae bacterium]
MFLLGQVTDAVSAAWAPRTRSACRRRCRHQRANPIQPGDRIFCALRRLLAVDDPNGAAQLLRASALWIRHTGIPHSLAVGTPLDVEMLATGHASAATTSRYMHSEARRLSQDVVRS